MLYSRMTMDKETFQKTERLYHYTSWCAAIKIIASRTLKFGKLQHMNDVNEAHRWIFYEPGVDLSSIKEELNRYCQISLVNDNKPRSGYNIPAMWGHYAEKGNGVCLVFDKQKLVSYLGRNMWKANIRYSRNYTGDIDIPIGDIERYFKVHKNEIFFKKTADWRYEQEFRVVARQSEKEELKLDFKDSLMAVIFYFAQDVPYDQCVFNSANVKALEKIEPALPILELGDLRGQVNLRDRAGVDWSGKDLLENGWELDV